MGKNINSTDEWNQVPKRYKLHKDTNFENQYRIVTAQFYKFPQTMLMVAHATGIERASICRFIAKLRKQNAVKRVKTDFCEITKFKAGYYCTNLNYQEVL